MTSVFLLRFGFLTQVFEPPVLPGFPRRFSEATGLSMCPHTLFGSLDVSGKGYEEVWRAVPCCAVNLTDCFWRHGKHVYGDWKPRFLLCITLHQHYVV